MSTPLKIAAGAIALLLIAGGASLFWGQHKKAQLRGDIATLVTDASDRLRGDLSLEADQSAANTAEAVLRLEGDSAAFDQQVAALHALDTARDAALAEAAEDYLTTARQLTMYQARMHRKRIDVAADAQALAEHIRTSNRRARGWIDQAMHRKELLEKKFFDYRLASDGFSDLARTYIPSRRRLVPLVGARAVVEEDLAIRARDQAREAAKQTAELVRQSEYLPPER